MQKGTAFEILQQILKFAVPKMEGVNIVKYPEDDEPDCFHLIMENNQMFTVFVMENKSIQNNAKLLSIFD